MMKSALSIIQSAMYRMNLTPPSSLVGSTDTNALNLLHTLYAVCEELRQAKVWTVQKKKHSFDTEASRPSYILPQDYYSPTLLTQWNQAENTPLVGPVSDGGYNWLLYGNAVSSLNYTYRLFGSDNALHSSTGSATAGLYQFEVNPTPASAQTLSFEYVSRDMFKPADWLPSTVYAAGAKVNSAGRNYRTTAGGTSGTTAPTGTANFTDNTVTWIYEDPTGVVNVQKETLNADTDLCIFDYDLVSLGIRAKYMEDHGGDSDGATTEFRSKIEQAVARYKGSYVGSMLNRTSGPRYHVPNRGWSI